LCSGHLFSMPHLQTFEKCLGQVQSAQQIHQIKYVHCLARLDHTHPGTRIQQINVVMSLKLGIPCKFKIDKTFIVFKCIFCVIAIHSRCCCAEVGKRLAAM
jgi:hypothetical protein